MKENEESQTANGEKKSQQQESSKSSAIKDYCLTEIKGTPYQIIQNEDKTFSPVCGKYRLPKRFGDAKNCEDYILNNINWETLTAVFCTIIDIAKINNNTLKK